jgi:hypothetical protein
VIAVVKYVGGGKGGLGGVLGIGATKIGGIRGVEAIVGLFDSRGFHVKVS